MDKVSTYIDLQELSECCIKDMCLRNLLVLMRSSTKVGTHMTSHGVLERCELTAHLLKL